MTDDRESDAILGRAATRGELLEVAQLISLALLSQTLFTTSLLDADEATQRDLGTKAVDHNVRLLRSTRKMLEQWSSGQ